ncbi:MAG: hypothetical protein LBL66_05530 [Clostridiales bacterium]|nr:hypothetical protein [Clostridiales bacterium]
MGVRIRNERGKRAGVPLSGRDCFVSLRAPRNDKRGVRAPRNGRQVHVSAAMTDRYTFPHYDRQVHGFRSNDRQVHVSAL